MLFLLSAVFDVVADVDVVVAVVDGIAVVDGGLLLQSFIFQNVIMLRRSF